MYSLRSRTYEEGRDAALLSLNESGIREYFAEWNGGVDDLPQSKTAFWRLIHQAITAVGTLPKEFRLKSKRWLISRGYGPLDDGQI